LTTTVHRQRGQYGRSDIRHRLFWFHLQINLYSSFQWNTLIYLADSKERLSGVLKRPASEIEGRIAYIMGVNGAGRLIKAAENKPHTAARDLLPRAAAVNRNLFYDKSGRALSASDLVNQLANNLQKEDRRWNVLATDDSDDDEMDDVASNPNALLLAQQFGNETTG
jgi:hypothetical protein